MIRLAVMNVALILVLMNLVVVVLIAMFSKEKQFVVAHLVTQAMLDKSVYHVSIWNFYKFR